MRAGAPLLFTLLAACDHTSAPADAAVDLPVAEELGPATYTFVLDAGVLPPASFPSVLVYVPARFHVVKPLRAVIWLHGNGNCVSNVIRDLDSECTPDAGTRSAHHLATQLETSQQNALLIVLELGYDDGIAAGNLANAGGMRALLAETLADLRPYLGVVRVDDLAPLVVASHSAGYVAAAPIVSVGGVPVGEVWHFDSLYGEITEFTNWIAANLHSFEGSPPACRLVDIYTHAGGTEANSVNLAETAEQDWLPDAGAVIDDRTLGDLSDDQLRHGLIFELSPLSHNDVARTWFVRLLSTADQRLR